MMFYLIVEIAANSPDDVAPVADALSRMRPMCLAEPGCVRWEAYQSQADAQRFVLVEHWATRELWDAHGELAAIQQVYVPEILPRITRTVHPARQL